MSKTTYTLDVIKNLIREKQQFDLSKFCKNILDELVDASKYSWFETGSEDYGGSPNKFFVVLDDVQPLNTLEDRLEELKQHLLLEHFTLESGVADIVGGLRVW